MTAIDPTQIQTAEREAKRARLFTRINKADAWFTVLGLGWITPMLKAAAGDNPRAQMKEVWRLLGVPVLAILCFIALWGFLAPKVQTSLGAIPGPAQVWASAVDLHQDAIEKAEKEAKKAMANPMPTVGSLSVGLARLARGFCSIPRYGIVRAIFLSAH